MNTIGCPVIALMIGERDNLKTERRETTPEDAILKMYTLARKQIIQKKVRVSGKQGKIEFDTSQLVSGTHLLRVLCSESIFIYRVVKE